jgi:DNA repair protein RadC
MISRGTVNSSLLTPREVFIEALKYHAVSVILLHNHPSGDPAPSKEDLLLTRRMKEAGSILNIPVIDHIIIGDNKYCSFKESGYL